jgi:hypothetical protein
MRSNSARARITGVSDASAAGAGAASGAGAGASAVPGQGMEAFEAEGWGGRIYVTPTGMSSARRAERGGSGVRK